VAGREIVRIQDGSHLFGTATPSSDLDIKSVFIPDARSILLQQARNAITFQRPKAEGERNVAGDVDIEHFSLQRYLGLLAEGQTIAIDMLFAPRSAMLDEPAAEWTEIVRNRHRLVSSKASAFIGYCRKQAAKYGIRGSRVAASRAALALLEDGLVRFGTAAKLALLRPEIEAMISTTQHMAIIVLPTSSGIDQEHWEVCDRKLPLTASIKNARTIMARLVEAYGHRALMAERQHGVDWKALSHAVRIGSEAIELLTTGQVTFPLPNAAHVLAIKRGERLYQEVAAEIEDLFVQVEEAARRSPLPDEPDLQWIDDFVTRIYRGAVLNE
jgi:hypothetical protein